MCQDASGRAMARQDAPGRARTPGLVIQELFFCVEDFSKFFGPSPRKHRLTVYRGLQVYGVAIFDGRVLVTHQSDRHETLGIL